jgi:hypothetical protein
VAPEADAFTPRLRYPFWGLRGLLRTYPPSPLEYAVAERDASIDSPRAYYSRLTAIEPLVKAQAILKPVFEQADFEWTDDVAAEILTKVEHIDPSRELQVTAGTEGTDPALPRPGSTNQFSCRHCKQEAVKWMGLTVYNQINPKERRAS